MAARILSGSSKNFPVGKLSRKLQKPGLKFPSVLLKNQKSHTPPARASSGEGTGCIELHMGLKIFVKPRPLKARLSLPTDHIPQPSKVQKQNLRPLVLSGTIISQKITKLPLAHKGRTLPSRHRTLSEKDPPVASPQEKLKHLPIKVFLQLRVHTQMK